MTYEAWYCGPQSSGRLEQGKQLTQQIQRRSVNKAWNRLLAVCWLPTKNITLQSCLRLGEEQYPSAWWGWRTLNRRHPLHLQENWRYTVAKRTEGLTWCYTWRLCCSEAYRHNVSLRRATTARKGEGEHIFNKSSSAWAIDITIALVHWSSGWKSQPSPGSTTDVT